MNTFGIVWVALTRPVHVAHAHIVCTRACRREHHVFGSVGEVGGDLQSGSSLANVSTSAAWSWVSPAVLCDIDEYFYAMPGR